MVPWPLNKNEFCHFVFCCTPNGSKRRNLTLALHAFYIVTCFKDTGQKDHLLFNMNCDINLNYNQPQVETVYYSATKTQSVTKYQICNRYCNNTSETLMVYWSNTWAVVYQVKLLTRIWFFTWIRVLFGLIDFFIDYKGSQP